MKGLPNPSVCCADGHQVLCSPDAGKGMSTRERLQRIEAKVRQMEQALGLDNPQVRLASSGSLHSAPCMLLIFVQALPVHTRRCSLMNLRRRSSSP